MRRVVFVALAIAGCGGEAMHFDRCQGFGVEVWPDATDGGVTDLAALAAGIGANVDGAACETLFVARVRCASVETIQGCGLASPEEAQALADRIGAYLANAWPALVPASNPLVDSCFCEAF